MPVPDTNTFTLNDVRTELGLGATTSLSACVAASVNTSYDPDYEPSPPTNNQLGFRNYNSSPDWWRLNDCDGGPAVTTRFKPAAINQRYVNPVGPINYTWAGVVVNQPTAPADYDASVQRVDGQFNCPP